MLSMPRFIYFNSKCNIYMPWVETLEHKKLFVRILGTGTKRGLSKISNLFRAERKWIWHSQTRDVNYVYPAALNPTKVKKRNWNIIRKQSQKLPSTLHVFYFPFICSSILYFPIDKIFQIMWFIERALLLTRKLFEPTVLSGGGSLRVKSGFFHH
jgi:hypothetical protein